MRRNETQSLGDVLRLTIQECDMSARLDEQRAISLWPRIVGDHIAVQCGRPRVKLGVMSIPVRAAALRHELTMNRSSIIRLINSRLGRDVITEIHFTG